MATAQLDKMRDSVLLPLYLSTYYRIAHMEESMFVVRREIAEHHDTVLALVAFPFILTLHSGRL